MADKVSEVPTQDIYEADKEFIFGLVEKGEIKEYEVHTLKSLIDLRRGLVLTLRELQNKAVSSRRQSQNNFEHQLALFTRAGLEFAEDTRVNNVKNGLNPDFATFDRSVKEHLTILEEIAVERVPLFPNQVISRLEIGEK